ncbi:MAG: hypothetical protein ACM309_00620 [Bacillota bacterium]
MAIKVARLEERMDDQEEYRRRQNGAIEKLSSQFESLRTWLIALLGGVVANLILQLAARR